MAKIRIRARLKNSVVEVKSLMDHIMETGRRSDRETGELIPAHYITEVTAKHNDVSIMKANFGPGVSSNPYLEFKFLGGKIGDQVSLSYIDNKGQYAEATVTVK